MADSLEQWITLEVISGLRRLANRSSSEAEEVSEPEPCDDRLPHLPVCGGDGNCCVIGFGKSFDILPLVVLVLDCKSCASDAASSAKAARLGKKLQLSDVSPETRQDTTHFRKFDSTEESTWDML